MRLRLARKAAGFQTEKLFAEKYNIPLTTYSQHETGKRVMAVEVLVRYSQRLKADLLWLLTGEKNLSSIPIKEKSPSMNDDHSISSQKANIDALKKILLLAKPLFPQDGHIFLHWMTQCIAAWTYLSSNKSDERKISEKI